MNTKCYGITFDGAKMDEYARGLISGVMYMSSGCPEETWSWCCDKHDNQWFKVVECTSEQFAEIVKTIEKLYPGVILETEEIEKE